MMVLGIDPGPTESAWVLYNPDSPEPIVSFAKEDNEKMLERFFQREFDLVSDYIAIEMVASYGMPVGKEVFETCVLIGRIIQLFQRIPVQRVYRKDIKIHLCNNMKAKDGNIRQALIDRLGQQGTKKSPGPTYGLSGDVWSALAVAITFGDSIKATAEIPQ